MKTERYEISFSAIDTNLSTSIRISKKEFLAQLAYLQKQVAETENNEYPMEYRTSESDFTGAKITYHTFTIGTADTTLKATVCKPGYVFKN